MHSNNGNAMRRTRSAVHNSSNSALDVPRDCVGRRGHYFIAYALARGLSSLLHLF